MSVDNFSFARDENIFRYSDKNFKEIFHVRHNAEERNAVDRFLSGSAMRKFPM